MTQYAIFTFAQMTINDNFSFVIFLKVIQNLYKASTFTQLGKTVGSAIYKKKPITEGDNNTSHTHSDDESTYTQRRISGNNE